MNLHQRLFCLWLVWGASWGIAAGPGVRFNEVHYRPTSGNLAEQFVELHNSTTNAINMQGWRLSGAIDFAFGQSVIPGGGYLVIVADPLAFQTKYPAVTNWVGPWSGLLDGRGSLRLRNSVGTEIATLDYDSEGDWGERRLETVEFGLGSWEWYAGHARGEGSAELVNPLLSANHGQNWATSAGPDGTPGALNSRNSLTTPPLVLSVDQRPPVPSPANTVTILARLADESPTPPSASLFWRIDGPSPGEFAAKPMADDGLHDDGLSVDGIYGARLPAQPLGTVVEYYISATDSSGQTRLYPAVQPNNRRTANLLYRVDTQSQTNRLPLFRLVMNAAEQAALDTTSDRYPGSDARSSGCWIAQEDSRLEIRQLVGLRNRGHGSRFRTPHNIRVDLPGDQPSNGRGTLNLNAQYPYLQVVGNALMRELGLIMPDARLVTLLVNGTNRANASQFGAFAANWSLDSRLIRSQAPLNSGGNIYRGNRSLDFARPADLSWRGTNYQSYTNVYFKSSRTTENDWSDLLDLIAVLNSENGYSADNYVGDVSGRLNVDEWCRYFASLCILDNRESNLSNGVGDDYALYSGPNDPRFLLLPYDLDTILGGGDAPGSAQSPLIQISNSGTLNRFIRTPEFSQRYYAQLRELCRGPLAPAAMTERLGRLLGGTGVPDSVINGMSAFNSNRTAYILSQIPSQLSVTSVVLTNAGWRYTVTNLITLSGRADPVATRSLTVGTTNATWNASTASWKATAPLQPGLNRIPITAYNPANEVVETLFYEIWSDPGAPNPVPATITADTIWTATNGPYVLTQSITVSPGATLTIEPGTSVFLSNNARVTVENGGRILAQGSRTAPISFSRTPNGEAWSGIEIRGGPNSPESRFEHAHFEGYRNTCLTVTDGTIWLDHLTFGTTTAQYLSLDRASFVVANCTFPNATTPFELVHGTGGIKAGGRGIIRRCLFGTAIGYNDALDFTGGNRELGQPIIEFYNNVFLGGTDDLLDLDGTDAWIEGNIFLHCHRNAPPDSASAISGGDNAGRTSELTIINNLFFDCDQAVTAKEGNYFTLLNNTIVHVTRAGGVDTGSGVVNLQDQPDGGKPTAWGAGCFLRENIVTDVEQLVRNDVAGVSRTTWVNNLLPKPWVGPGSGNRVTDPQFQYVPTVDETQFSTWAGAQILWTWFSLQPGSPARGVALDGGELGARRTPGVRLVGKPASTTREQGVILSLSPVLATTPGTSTPTIPAAGWPQGAGYISYRWRLDGGGWSPETAATQSLILTNLAPGQHELVVSGRRDSQTVQDDPVLGPDAAVTSITWNVDSNLPKVSPAHQVLIHEVLAHNTQTEVAPGYFPDLVELYNSGTETVDLSGFGLSQSTNTPFQFRFPPGSLLAPQTYWVLLAENRAPAGVNLLPLGFRLSRRGDSLFLYDSQTNRLNQVVFGPQLANLSIGRRADFLWSLCVPTLGSANITVPLGDPTALRINEWLARPGPLAAEGYVELYNRDSRPVDLSGLYLANAPASPRQHPFTTLSFIGGHEFAVFIADGDRSRADHVGFTLSPETGFLGLTDRDLTPIDRLVYGTPSVDLAEGRSPDGAPEIRYLALPTPGSGNPTYQPPDTNALPVRVVLNEIMTDNRIETEATVGLADWLELYNAGSEPADLGGWELTDDLVAPTRFRFPATTRLEAGQFLRILCDPNQPASPTNSGFGLSRTGGALYLLNPAAGGTTVHDSLTYGLQARNFSLARIPDGATNWSLATASPGAPNRPAAYEPATAVRINEWLADNSSGDDWFELYNPNPVPVRLDDYQLSDDPEAPMKYAFPAHSYLGIGPGAWVRMIAAGTANPTDATRVNFKLGKTGDELVFSSPAGDRLDLVTWGPQQPDVSEGRLPDGGTMVVKFPTLPTPGARNVADADRDGMADDWETANGLNPQDPSDAPADLDRDGLTNAQEYRIGTDPRNHSSGLQLLIQRLTPGELRLQYTVPAAQRFTLQECLVLPGPWQTVNTSEPADFTRTLEYHESVGPDSPDRYFRIIAQP